MFSALKRMIIRRRTERLSYELADAVWRMTEGKAAKQLELGL